MKAGIIKLVHASPFVPFTIHLADGSQLKVPTVDHIAVPPAGRRIFVFSDDGGYEFISYVMIRRVTLDSEAAPSSQAQ